MAEVVFLLSKELTLLVLLANLFLLDQVFFRFILAGQALFYGMAYAGKGSWFTGRIVYRGREMTGIDDVEAAPLLGPDGRPITARGWFDSESIALDGTLVYIGLERVNQILRYDFAKGFTRARGEVVRWSVHVIRASRQIAMGVIKRLARTMT